MDKSLIVVNYHYIRKQIPNAGIYPITPKHFIKQLDLIYGDGYKFISIGELNASIINKDASRLPNKSCLITFDDGLLESYENGYSILKNKGIPGVFYVLGDVIENNNIPNTHKIHYLRSILENESILFDHFSKSTTFTDQIKSNLSTVAKLQYTFDTEETAILKYYLNFIATPAEVNKLFNKFSEKSEEEVCKKLFMSNDNIIDLSKNGCLGCHGFKHVPLALLSQENMKDNILHSKNCIQTLTGDIISSISYPFGETMAISNELFETCKTLDFTSGFTMKRGINKIQDVFNNPLEIKRYDTTEVYGGKYA